MTVATIDPDGKPQLSVVWAKHDGDDVLFSTIKGRRKYANLIQGRPGQRAGLPGR